MMTRLGDKVHTAEKPRNHIVLRNQCSSSGIKSDLLSAWFCIVNACELVSDESIKLDEPPPPAKLGSDELPTILVLPEIEDELPPMLDPELDDPPPVLKPEPEEPPPAPEL